MVSDLLVVTNGNFVCLRFEYHSRQFCYAFTSAPSHLLYLYDEIGMLLYAFSLFLFLHACLSACLSVCISVCLFLSLPLFSLMSLCLLVCLSACLSLCLLVCLSLCLSLCSCLSVSQPISPFACLSVSQPVSLCLPVCTYTSVCLISFVASCFSSIDRRRN